MLENCSKPRLVILVISIMLFSYSSPLIEVQPELTNFAEKGFESFSSENNSSSSSVWCPNCNYSISVLGTSGVPEKWDMFGDSVKQSDNKLAVYQVGNTKISIYRIENSLGEPQPGLSYGNIVTSYMGSILLEELGIRSYDFEMNDEYLLVSKRSPSCSNNNPSGSIFLFSIKEESFGQMLGRIDSPDNTNTTISPTSGLGEICVTTTYDEFGRSLSIQENLFFIGAPCYLPEGTEEPRNSCGIGGSSHEHWGNGAIHVYEWGLGCVDPSLFCISYKTRIDSPDIQAGFGSTIDIENNVLAVGSQNAKRYLYTFDDNVTIINESVENVPGLGFNADEIYLEGDFLFTNRKINSLSPIYKRNSEGEFQLFSTIPYFSDSSFDISGDLIAIGSPWESHSGIPHRGVLRIYQIGNNTSATLIETIFQPDENHGEDWFGGDVSFHQGRLVVSSARFPRWQYAPGSDSDESFKAAIGKVWIYYNSSWYQDEDGDGVKDQDDQCPGFDDNIDLDYDGIIDGCDPSVDYDEDGVDNKEDQCPGTPDEEQVDVFGCGPSQIDSDGDGFSDAIDLCPGYDDNIDVDNDGLPDYCDGFIDSDLDGIKDSDDQCPGYDDNDDLDGDGIANACDSDRDGDGVSNIFDRCAGGDDRMDEDNDGIPDDCDTLIDSDNDGISDTIDQCEGHDDSIDIDNDGTSDGCDSLIDSDLDGVGDDVDQCMGYDDSIDLDSDKIPDACDSIIDSDSDGVSDENDQCDGYDDLLDLDSDGNPDGCEVWILSESTERFVMLHSGISLVVLFLFVTVISRKIQ